MRRHFLRNLYLNTVLAVIILYFHIEQQLRWYPPSTGINAGGDLLRNLVLQLIMVSVVAVLAIIGAAMFINWLAQLRRR
jgi:hypothetical protein